MRLLSLFFILIIVLSFNSLSLDAFRPCKDGASSRCLRKESISKSASAFFPSRPSALFAAMRFKNFEQVLKTFHEEPVVIYFGNSNCGPCRLMKKEMVAVKEMVGHELKLFSIDTEKWPEVGSRFDVARVPTLVLFRGGEIQLRLEGLNSAETVVEQVRSLL